MSIFTFMLSVVSAVTTSSLLADTFTWTGAVDGDFEDSTKWILSSTSTSPAEGVYPGEGDTVVIPSYDAVYTVTVNHDLNVASLTVGSEEGATVTVCFANGIGVNNVAGDVVVFKNGVLSHSRNPVTVTSVNNVKYKLNLKVGGKMEVYGTVSADLCGFNKGQALRYAHGGYGGNLNSSKLGTVYGSIREPVDPGAGGQSSIGGDCHGGGVISLDVERELVVFGVVSAEGAINVWDSGSAGGSILIKCATLSGTGKIYARPSSYGNTQGGGGRIAIYQKVATNWDAFVGIISSSNYKTGNQWASPGTIYLEHAADTPTEGDLIIDGTSTKYKQPAVIATTVTDWDKPFGRVFVKNAAYLRVDNDATLKVRRLISVDSAATLSTETGTAAIELVPPKGGTVEISGKVSAQNFICHQPDCTIAFKNGAKLDIPLAGLISIFGTEEEPIKLLPSTEESKYSISLGNDLSKDSLVKYVAISNCNASANAITAYDSIDLGGNSNAFFISVPKPGDKIVWHGAKNTVWANGANWTPSRIPIETDIIEIPTGCARYPIMTDDSNIDTIKIAEGATLTVNGGAVLSVFKDFENLGTLTLNNGSLLKIAGSADQLVELNNSTYAAISVEKSGGSVKFLSGFSSTIFDAYAAGTTSLEFASGEEVHVEKLNIDGAIVENGEFKKNITLISSEEGTKWKLIAGIFPIIRGALISDCDASGGSEIKVGGLCEDATGNINIDFSSGAAYYWTGAAGTEDFNTAGNWVPQEVPASGFIQINPRSGNNTVLLPQGESSLNLHSVFVEGIGSATAKLTARAHLNITDSFVIGANGTVALDYRDFNKVNINTIQGDFLIKDGGTLTHTPLPSTAKEISDGIYAVCVNVLGDMKVSQKGKVDVGSCGYPLGKGPGYTGGGAAHGASGNTDKACYGSIFNPSTHGSSGKNNNYGTVGGGVVNLYINGDLYLDGPICASVTGKNKVNSRHDGGGAGGSVLVKCATLKGAGEISAYGNPQGNNIPGGGRIALYQRVATDWSQYTGKIINGNNITTHGACGPIYLECAGDKPYGGILKIVSTSTSSKNWSSTARTQFPMSDDAGISYDDLTIVVEGGYLSFDGSGAPAVGKQIRIKDLVLKGLYARVLCKGRIVTVLSREHKGGKGWYSTYATHITEDGGKVRWVGGMSIIIR